ncbi:MAG: hypothetical protein ACREXX_04030 [Gammaproteobacteria bacterium]
MSVASLPASDKFDRFATHDARDGLAALPKRTRVRRRRRGQAFAGLRGLRVLCKTSTLASHGTSR